MTFRRRAVLFLWAASLVPLLPACRPLHNKSEPQPTAPPGEVWLTPAQVKDAKIEVAVVDLQDTDDTILTSGKVTFDDSLVQHVFSPVTGRVREIDAKLGMHVKKGDTLVSIISPDVGAASADLGKAHADLIAAEHDYQRKKDLYEHHAASQADLEMSEDNYRKARAEMERALQKQRLLRAGGIDTVTQSYTVRAAIDGEVVARMVNPGMEIQGQYGGGTPFELLTIGDLDRVWVIADVFEMDLPRVQPGAPALVTVVAYPGRHFAGKVDWVSGVLDPTTRTAKVRCTFENKDRPLRPEMFATVYISVDERRTLAVPRSSIIRLGEQAVVFIEKGKAPDGRIRFERVPVAVDEGEGSKWVPVSHGLERGMNVVTAGAVLLSGNL